LRRFLRGVKTPRYSETTFSTASQARCGSSRFRSGVNGAEGWPLGYALIDGEDTVSAD
jgi:hypothetical protein